MMVGSLSEISQASACELRGLMRKTLRCANAVASCSDWSTGNSSRLAARKGHNVPRGRVHLAGPRPMIIAGLLAGLANRLAVVRIALHRAALVLGDQVSARTVIAP